jgi:hypothetical protein
MQGGEERSQVGLADLAWPRTTFSFGRVVAKWVLRLGMHALALS